MQSELEVKCNFLRNHNKNLSFLNISSQYYKIMSVKLKQIFCPAVVCLSGVGLEHLLLLSLRDLWTNLVKPYGVGGLAPSCSEQ